MNKFLIIILINLFTLTAMAGEFDKSFGVRSFGGNGIFIEKPNDDFSSTRYMVTWRDNGMQFSTFKVFHFYNVLDWPDNYFYYYGYGAHVGYVKWRAQKIDTAHGYYWRSRSAPVAGLDGLFGVGYSLDNLPLAITADINPYFDFFGRKFFEVNPLNIGISLVYSF